MHDTLNRPIGIFKDHTLPLGAGGFVQNYDQASDGSYQVHGTDVAMGYIRANGDSQWRLLLRPDNMPVGHFDPFPDNQNWGDSGIAGLRISRSNVNRLYVSWQGRVYRSDNKAGSWTYLSALGVKALWGNYGQCRTHSACSMDIHPTNPDIMVIGTYRAFNGSSDATREGVFYTQDAGLTFTKIAGIPTLYTQTLPANIDTYRYLVRFDHANPNNVYIAVPGSGLWVSTTGITGAFTLSTGSPTYISCITINNSNVWVCKWRAGGGGPVPDLYKLVGTTWTTSTSGIDGGAMTLAISPFDNNKMFTMGENGGTTLSRDGGTTWDSNIYAGLAGSRGDGEISWISNTNLTRFPANVRFDTQIPDKVWMVDGVGISWCMIPATAGTSIVWHDYAQGNEELIITSIRTFPNMKEPLITCWDKPLWKMKNLDAWTNNFTYPTLGGIPRDINMVTKGDDIDQAIDDPKFFVMVCGQGGIFNGYSTDGAESFTQIDQSKYPTGTLTPGGACAVSNKNNYMIMPSNNGIAYYTKDSGVTFNTIKLDGITPTGSWANAYYVTRKNVSSDKTRPGVFGCVYTAVVFGNIRLMSTANVALSGGTAFPTIDGVVTAAGDLVALKNQTAPAQNGVYTVGGISTAWTLTRAPGYDSYGLLINGAFSLGGNGVTQQWGTWTITAPAGGTLEISPITIVSNNSATNPLAGFWVTLDGGDTWTHKITGVIDNHTPNNGIDNRQFWSGQILAIPGFTGEWLWTGHSDGGDDALMWLKNDGATRQDIKANVRNVGWYEFGAPFPGQTRPSVVFHGKVNNIDGLYYSYDWFVTDPILITRFVQNGINGIGIVGASKDKFGVILASANASPSGIYYYGVHGKGVAA